MTPEITYDHPHNRTFLGLLCETVAVWLGSGTKSAWLGLGKDPGLG